MSSPATSTGAPAFPQQRTRPLEGPWSPPDHLQLAMDRLRNAAPVDTVDFVSACPACGQDTTWREEREDTRLRITLSCPCAP